MIQYFTVYIASYIVAADEMSANTFPLSGNPLNPTGRSSISSAITNVIVDSDAGNSSLLIVNDSNNSMYIDKYSNIAINHASPVAQLDVSSGNGACLLLRYNKTSNASTMYVSNDGKLSINASGGEINSTAVAKLTNSTGSTSSSTGAMIVSGGVGIGEKLYVNSGIYGTLQTAAQSNITSVGSLTGLTLNGVLASTQGWVDTSSSFRVTGGNSPTYGNGIGLRYNGMMATGFLSSHNHQLSTLNNIDIQDNMLYFKSDRTIGFNTTTPYAFIDINQASSTSNKLRLSYTSNSVFSELYCDASGNLQLGNTVLGSGKTLTLGSAVIDETDITKLDSITNGTAAANKAVVLGASREIATIGNITSDGILTLSNTTDASSTSTGGVIISGGVGIAKKLYVGTDLNIAGAVNMGGTQVIDSSRNATFTTVTTTTEAFASSSTKAATTAYVQNELLPRLTATHAPTGIENTTDSVIAYNPTTRVLTLSPTGTSFNVWVSGVRYTISSTQTMTAHPSTQGITYYYYFDTDGVMKYSTTYPMYFDKAMVSILYYYDATHTIVTEERHGTVMDPATHMELHNNIGTYYVSGLALTGYTITPGSPSDATNTFAIASGVISDEQLNSTISAVVDGGPYTVFYMSGAGAQWTWITGNSVPYAFSAGSYIDYNQWTGSTWQLTDSATNNQYVNYYVLFVPSFDTNTQILMLPGQTVYSTLAAAVAEVFHNLSLSTLPIPEYLPLYQITYKTGNSYASSGKCRIEQITRIVGTRVAIQNNVATNHQALSGLQLAALGSTYGHISDLPQTIAGAKTFSDTTNATSTITGAVIIGGGIGIASDTWMGGSLNIASTKTLTLGSAVIDETDITKLDSITNGTAAANKAIVLGASREIATIGNITSDGILTLSNTTDSSSTSTGGVIISGGVGIAKKLYVGTDLNIAGTVNMGGTQIIDSSRNASFTTLNSNGIITSTIVNDTTGLVTYQRWTNDVATDVITALQMSNIGSVIGTTSAHPFRMMTNANAHYYCTSDGYTSIGTTATSQTTYDLAVQGSLNCSSFYVNGVQSIDNTGKVIVAAQSNITSLGTLTGLTLNGSLSLSAVTTVNNTMVWTSGTVPTTTNGVGIRFNGLANGGTGYICAYNYVLSQDDNLTLNNDNIYIKNNRNVGIDNSNPQYKLDVAGTLNCTGIITLTNATDASSTTVAGVVISGGVGIAKKLYLGDNINIASGKTITLGSAVIDETDITKIDAITNGTAAASKAVILGASREIATIGNITSDGVLTVSNTTDASSTITGSVIISGGVGIAKKLYIGDNVSIASTKTLTLGFTIIDETDIAKIDSITNGTAAVNKAVVLGASREIATVGNITSDGVLTVSNVTDASSTITGSVIISGGVGIAKKLYVGDNVNIASGKTITLGNAVIDETDITKIDAITNGTAAANKAVVLGASREIATIGNITSDGVLTVSNTTDASSTITGSVIISGGVGIAKKLFAGTNATIGGGTISYTTASAIGLDSVIKLASTTLNNTSATGTDDIHRTGLYLSGPVLTSTNTITTTTAATLYIGGVPTAGTNQTILNPWGLYCNGGAYFTGNIFIGNKLAFAGTSGDLGNDFTVIAERIYGGTEKSEMVIFKGNDVDTTSGPDRIRIRAAEIRVQTYTSPETYATLADNNDRLTIGNDGKISVLAGTDATSSTTGSLVVTGGVGISGRLVVPGGISAGPTYMAGYPISMINSGLGNGGVFNCFRMGKQSSSNDIATFSYVHTSDGSTSNRFSIDFYGTSGCLSAFAGNMVSVNSTSTGTGRFHVEGNNNYTFTSGSLYRQTFTDTGATFTSYGSPNYSATISISCTDNILTGGYLMRSDRRLKKNIKPLEFDINKYMGLEPVSFDWKRTNEHDIGFIAQEVLVSDDQIKAELIQPYKRNDMKGDPMINDGICLAIKYSKIPIMNHKMLKHHHTEIDELRQRIASLEEQLAECLHMLRRSE